MIRAALDLAFVVPRSKTYGVVNVVDGDVELADVADEQWVASEVESAVRDEEEDYVSGYWDAEQPSWADHV
jgi:hypothetical protein